MSHTDRLRNAPKIFRRLTGITPAAFDRLLEQLVPRQEQAEAQRQNRPGRKRKPGGGRKRSLSLADRLLMLLIYYRTYVSHVFLGFLLGIDDSAVGRNINPLQPLFRQDEGVANGCGAVSQSGEPAYADDEECGWSA